jgi:glycerophosphoryl diester phosphodiesterase
LIFQKPFHIQGHRGARGLLPENTIESCCRAVALGVDGLEIDVVVSRDNQLVVAHDPWMLPLFCSFPDGKPLNTEGVLLKNLTVSEIQKYDCGSRGNPRFPNQEKIKCFKPTFYELVNAVHSFCESSNLPKPFWNIEAKSHPKWYGRLVPPPPIFARLLNHEIKKVGLDMTNSFYFSSFDPNILRVLKKQTPTVKLAFLTENRLSFKQNIKNLGFKPAIYSPYFKFLNKKTIEIAHRSGVKIITWTVNEEKTADILRGWQVDGVITDFPNRIGSHGARSV